MYCFPQEYMIHISCEVVVVGVATKVDVKKRRIWGVDLKSSSTILSRF